MARRGRQPPADEERRRVFRRMEWTFVWLPPLLLLVVGIGGAALLAWMAAVPGTTFRQRWLVIAVVVFGVPLLGMLIRRLFRR